MLFWVSVADCNQDTCVGLSSGTATTAPRRDAEENDDDDDDGSATYCSCRCHRHLPTFREDLRICVDDIRGEFYFFLLLISSDLYISRFFVGTSSDISVIPSHFYNGTISMNFAILVTFIIVIHLPTLLFHW